MYMLLVIYVVSCPTLAVPRPETLDLKLVSNRLPEIRWSVARPFYSLPSKAETQHRSNAICFPANCERQLKMYI